MYECVNCTHLYWGLFWLIMPPNIFTSKLERWLCCESLKRKDSNKVICWHNYSKFEQIECQNLCPLNISKYQEGKWADHLLLIVTIRPLRKTYSFFVDSMLDELYRKYLISMWAYYFICVNDTWTETETTLLPVSMIFSCISYANDTLWKYWLHFWYIYNVDPKKYVYFNNKNNKNESI